MSAEYIAKRLAQKSGGLRRRLSTIKVLYRDSNGVLWGIPYFLRHGQSPRDLEAHPQRSWIYLGSTHVARGGQEKGRAVGWFGSSTGTDIRSIKDFLQKHADRIPLNPYEYDAVRGESAHSS